MKFLQFVIVAVASYCAAAQNEDRKLFPEDFLLGSATSAFQIEGGWDADGKGEGIWDHSIHTNPGMISDGSNADVACDSYHNWRKDIDMLKHLGAKIYRFSISWPRILPGGFSNNVSQAGLDYYNNLIDGLIEAGIEPMITLYHWDLPQKLSDIGGWASPLIADYFEEFARVAYSNFGDRVKYWLTFNEPFVFCGGYTATSTAPGFVLPGIGNYLCSHNVIKSHARAYHLYDNEFRATQNGKVSMTVNCDHIFPATDSQADIEAAERVLQFHCGWHLHPIVNGNYPDVMIERIAYRSKLEGFSTSRLPEFTEEEQAYIKGTYDYIGLNSYGMSGVKDVAEEEIGEPSYDKDIKYAYDWGSGFEGDLPAAFRAVINWVSKNTNGSDIIITENGIGSYNAVDIEDDTRIEYLQGHLISLLDTILIDKVKVFGYTAWSLMDNFEWGSGFSNKFGLFWVNFTDPERSRTPKKSAEWYRLVIESRDPTVNLTTLNFQ